MADLADKESFVSHLVELRDRILRSLLAVVVLILVLVPFANDLYVFFAKPLMAALPEGTSMISTEPHGPFFVPLKLVIALSVILAMPYLLHQLWAFVAPGLYDNEKALAVPLLVSSTLLFYLGIIFAYFVVFPLVFAFFTSTAPEGVAVMTDINAYFSFCMKLFFAFGVSFEVPVATVIMVKMGLTTPEDLSGKRPYVIVGAFVVGMLMTPPDIFSQTLLALPVWLLFEVGVKLSKRFRPEGAEEDSESEGSDR
ncbi:MAG TPA: twin-arginine translocase subunit TatC [Arenicellales bacterium]|nr:twin-arginine translocase subunit TatC [Arenicellales bacterium]